MDARYILLESDTRDVRDRADAEECEDVVSVAKRNVERVANEVLINQRERTELARLLDAEGAEMKREEEARNHLLLSEVGRLTRNVILMQTRLMILEEKRFERDKLFGQVCQAEEQLASLDKHHANALEEAHQKQRLKYERLHAVLDDRMRLVSQCAGHVGCSQQIAALKERGLRILATQARLRKVEVLMLNLHQQNGDMKETIGTLKRELRTAHSLADTLAEKTEKAKKNLQSFIKLIDKEKDTDSEDLETKFESLILELETKIYERNDQMEQLNEIAEDQRCYQEALKEEDLKRRERREKLIAMSRVAEHVMGDAHLIQKQTQETLPGRSTFLMDMSTIMLEVTTDSEKIDKTQSQSEIDLDSCFSYTTGFLGLVPGKSTTSRSSKSHSSCSILSMESKQIEEEMF